MRPTECKKCGSKRLTFTYSNMYSVGSPKPTHRQGHLECSNCGHIMHHLEKIEEES